MPEGTPPRDRPECPYPPGQRPIGWWSFWKHPFRQAHCDHPGSCECGWPERDHLPKTPYEEVIALTVALEKAYDRKLRKES